MGGWLSVRWTILSASAQSASLSRLRLSPRHHIAILRYITLAIALSGLLNIRGAAAAAAARGAGGAISSKRLARKRSSLLIGRGFSAKHS